MRSTKNAFLYSVISLALCIAMLAGVTYAWFTDTVTSGTNTIVAGNLDIEVEYSKNGTDWNTVEGATSIFSDVTLWEPGATSVAYLKITNKGTLAVKYNLSINAEGGDFTNMAGNTVNLKDALVFTQNVMNETLTTYEDRDAAYAAAGTTQGLSDYTRSVTLEAGKYTYIALIVVMPTTVGNDFNYLTGTTAPKIELGVKLVATQYTKESDSFDNQYDATSPWTGAVDTAGLTANTDTSAKTVKIYSAEQLAAFAAAVNANTDGDIYKGYIVTLEKDIDLNNVAWTPISGTNQQMIFDGQNHTISNLKATGTKGVGLFGSVVMGEIKNVKIKNATVTGVAYVGALVGSAYVKVSGCTVENVTINAVGEWDGTQYVDGAKAGGIVGLLREEAGEQILNCSATNVTINGYRDLGGIVGCIYSNNTVTGNTISDVTINQGNYADYESGDYTTLGAIYGRMISNGDGTIQDNTGDATIHPVVIVAAAATAEETKTNVVSAISSADAGAIIALPEVEQVIDLSSTTINKAVTIQGNDDVTVKISTPGSQPSVNPSTDDEVVFDGVTFDFGNQNYNGIGIYNTKVTYKNCTINGFLTTYNNATFENCTFTNTGDNYCVNVYGGTATFTDCVFNGDVKCVYVYTDGGDATATFTDCEFTFSLTTSSGTVDKSAVMLNANNGTGSYTVTLTNCTQTNGNTTAAENVAGNTNYQGIYGLKHKDGNGNAKLVKGTVTVNGTVVYTQE